MSDAASASDGKPAPDGPSAGLRDGGRLDSVLDARTPTADAPATDVPAADVAPPDVAPPDVASDAAAPDAPQAAIPPVVLISEIMYHPVAENAAVEGHEFLELHNPGTKNVALGGWKVSFSGQPAFTFPAESTITAGGYIVLAKDRSKLMALYQLPGEQVFGDYVGELDNGDDTVTLRDTATRVVDVVRYDDKFPWPIGADALGAGRSWFAPGEYAKHQYKGRSLERSDFTLPGSELRTWDASPLDGPTPGRANTMTGPARAVVTDIAPRGTVVAAGAPVALKVTMSAGTVTDLEVEYFVDDLGRSDATEAPIRASLMLVGSAHTAMLPAFPAQSIVRYRIVGSRNGGSAEIISPRPSDPYAFHTFFAEASPAPPPSAYQIFVAPANWTQMWTNLNGGPNLGCERNPNWDARLPAVVIREGRVQDILVRYQGSRYQRTNGFRLPPWPDGKGPAQPSDLRALSWSLSYPSHDRWGNDKNDRRDSVNLSKQHQACPGIINSLASKLHWAAAVKTQRFRFARLYVNGSYYHYMMEVEGIDEDLLEKTATDASGVGDLFKSDGGVNDNLGPWGRGNFGPLDLNSSCPARWSKLDRYRTTYERQTHDWKSDTTGHDELISIIETLRPLYQSAKSSGDWQPVRGHLNRYFDVPQLLTQWAIRNFAAVWDDGVHNFYLYKRSLDGKYEVFPQDFDLEFGGDSVRSPSSSIFAGEEGVGADPAGGTNWLKTALLKAFRDEFRARIIALRGGVLAQSNVMSLLNEASTAWDQASWDASPAQGKCDVNARLDATRTWLTARYQYLDQQGLK